MKNPNNEPEKIRLTEDFLDLKVGMALPQGTILIRSSSGQYITEGTRLGQGGAVAGFFLIKEISEPINTPPS